MAKASVAGHQSGVALLCGVAATWAGYFLIRRWLRSAAVPEANQAIDTGARKMSTHGAYRIWVANKDGGLVGFDPNKPEGDQYPDPADAAAVDIYFGINSKAPQPPPKEQIALQSEIEKTLGAVQRLYLVNPKNGRDKFRHYFTRLFRLTQLGLEGPDASPELAKGGLTAIVADLIQDEGGHVKNGHLNTLGRTALTFAIPFALGYLVLTLGDPRLLDHYLTRMAIQRTSAANFMLLWLGCFLGVWLSYGIRTSVLTLSDLTSTDSDRLLPHLRLAFAGFLTMILGMLFMLQIVEIKLGGYLITEIATHPTLAMVVGIFCGISELILPTAVGKRATALIAEIK